MKRRNSPKSRKHARSHTQRRAYERFGVYLSESDYRSINEDIQGKRKLSQLVGRQSNSRSV